MEKRALSWYHRRAHGSIADIMVPHGTPIPVDQEANSRRSTSYWKVSDFAL